MGEAADFFVSYAQADRAWAEWIAWQLEVEGYKVVIQAWDFTPGHDWVDGMHQATATAGAWSGCCQPPISSRPTVRPSGRSSTPRIPGDARAGCCR